MLKNLLLPHGVPLVAIVTVGPPKKVLTTGHCLTKDSSSSFAKHIILGIDRFCRV